MKNRAHILVVDDDYIITKTLVDIFRIKNFNAAAANSGREALEKIKSLQFAVMLTDIRMPEMSGVELLIAAKKIQPDLTVIMMTAYARDELVKEGIRGGAINVLTKPLDIDYILKIIP